MAEFRENKLEHRVQYKDVDDLIKNNRKVLQKGPVAIVFAEDSTELDSTIQHNLHIGFHEIVVAVAPEVSVRLADELNIHVIPFDVGAGDATCNVVNTIAAAAVGTWIYYCFNAEYLFFPFCENRTVGEMLAHNSEERRSSVLSYVIDLYADDLDKSPSAVSLESACLDKSGYYALARENPDDDNKPRERQLDFFGGLRWRFEEHIPYARRKIDRIALFKSKPGLELQSNHTLNDQEMNTFACPWHHNMTAAICSFRTAKALKSNPGSKHEIDTFIWRNSTPFTWNSQQLLDLGLMEPGQWF